MEKKKIFVVILALITIGFLGFYLTKNKIDPKANIKQDIQTEQQTENQQEENITNEDKKSEEKNINNVKQKEENITIKKGSIQKEDNFVTKTKLYNDLPSSALPLSAISVLSELPQNIQENIMKIAETNNIYMIQHLNNKLLVISDNPANIRHNIEFTEILIPNGQQNTTTLGYSDKMKDSKNDKWEYNELKQPVRHTKYNDDGDADFIEVWNYDNDNPIKYEIKDSQGKVISLRKETLENGTNLRVEHLLYNKEGNTRINVSATYEGEDIKRFTYYNADKPNESGSIFSDYADGLKTKETVYTSDLKVKNTYTSEYKDGTREDIIKWDNKNQEVHKYLPEDEAL